MPSSLSSREFLLHATACIKAADAVLPASGSGQPLSLPEADAPVVRALGNGLCVVYLVETDDGLVHVQNRDLEGTGLTPDGLHELGLHNLRKRAAAGLRMQQYGAVQGLLLDGLFEASLLLIDDLWDETLAHVAPNGFVAALPSRDVLAICDARSPEGLAGLRALVERVSAGGDHLVTRTLYRRIGDGWAALN